MNNYKLELDFYSEYNNFFRIKISSFHKQMKLNQERFINIFKLKSLDNLYILIER